MCQRVRKVLAIYPSLQVAVDQAPRPAHLRRVLEHHLDQARELAQWLQVRDDPLLWDLTVAGFHFAGDVPNLVQGLERLRKAGERVRRQLQRKESRHGPTHQAQRAVIQQLACIFDFYHRGEESDLQTLKAEFVKAALDAAQIPSPRFAASEARSASRSRLVRLLPKPCPACRARGRSERLASDWVWERIQACAARVQTEALQTENKELTLERAVAEVLKTREGQQLYDAGVKLFAVPEKAARGSAEVRLVLANAGIRLEEQPRTRLRDDGAEEVPK